MAAIDVALAERLIGEHSADLDEVTGRMGKVRRYLRGDQDLPYIPRGARNEYRRTAEESVTNWLGLISDTFVKGLFVDGYRAPRSENNAAAWDWWQANGLDARQGIIHRGAIDYGHAYGLVLPSKGSAAPVMQCLSPLRSAAWYRDDDDEHPEIGMRVVGTAVDGTRLWDIYDDNNVYTFALPSAGGMLLANTAEHGLGVTPFVRFRDRLDGEAVGLIQPLIGIQDRINNIVFSTMIALQYAAFRQRWATGMAIPVDEEETLSDGSANPNFGKPVEAFSAAVDRLWMTDSPDAKFGEFAQTETSGHAILYNDAVKTLAALAQISPNVLTGDLVNLSGDALAQLEQSTQRKLGEFETLFGESWESFFRLAGKAAKNPAAADPSAQVRWRDTEARSLAQTVDALGKLAQMLEVPVEALWERVPGVTDTDLLRWRALREDGDIVKALAAGLDRQSATLPPAPVSEAA